ncbi:MAG: helix-turn-helix transcriptional regulator [Streptosporangiaceae bacterium]|nr:helix-turn-helix transcriptional regulator [Streptosporangiaceae bacterium]
MQERTFPSATHRPVSAADPAERFSIPSADDPRCVVRDVLDRITDKWTFLVITILADGPLGYAEMRRSTAGISDKMLAQTLRKLERHGLVSRTVHATKPIRVTYALTTLGTTLVPPVAALREWATDYGPHLLANQDASRDVAAGQR